MENYAKNYYIHEVLNSGNITTRQATRPKTKSSIRTVPINADLFALLKPYIKEDRIFDYKNTYVSKFYSNLFKTLNINATGHTFVTNAFEIGVPPHIVQRWAGWSKAEQADTYLDLRKTSEFTKTIIIEYMIELKAKYVPNV
jgi:integrase